MADVDLAAPLLSLSWREELEAERLALLHIAFSWQHHTLFSTRAFFAAWRPGLLQLLPQCF